LIRGQRSEVGGGGQEQEGSPIVEIEGREVLVEKEKSPYYIIFPA